MGFKQFYRSFTIHVLINKKLIIYIKYVLIVYVMERKEGQNKQRNE
jgi:hypothetical protein